MPRDPMSSLAFRPEAHKQGNLAEVRNPKDRQKIPADELGWGEGRWSLQT
jgi:hypothetical protein